MDGVEKREGEVERERERRGSEGESRGVWEVERESGEGKREGGVEEKVEG